MFKAANSFFFVRARRRACNGATRILGNVQSGGAGKWQDSYTETLRGADVVIVGRQKCSGRAPRRTCGGQTSRRRKIIRVIELPDVDGKPVKDAFDFFAAGGDAGQIGELVDMPAGMDTGQHDEERRGKSWN